MVKEETKDKMLSTNNKYKPLQDQLDVCLKLFDAQSSEDCNTDNQGIFTELDDLMKEYEESSQKANELLARKNSEVLSKSSLDDTSNVQSCLSAIDIKTYECSSPVSNTNMSSRDRSSSFNWLHANNPDLDQLKLDLIKLKEENKYLKKRIGSNNPIVADLKCEICPNYIETINSLRKEKDAMEIELSETIESLQHNYHSATTELTDLRNKYSLQQKELLEKINNEGTLISKLTNLEKRNEDLSNHVKTVLSTKEGFEGLQNTVSDLSLALIDRNEKDLSAKQIRLIKDLFSEAQIKVITEFRERVKQLEMETLDNYEHRRNLITKQKEIMLVLKKYAIAVKECIDVYTYLDAANSDFSENDTIAHINNHASEFLYKYEDDVNEVLTTLGSYADDLKRESKLLNEHSEDLDLQELDLMYKSPVKTMTSPKSLNFPSPKGTNPFTYTMCQTPKEANDPKTDFMKRMLEEKDREISHLKDKLLGKRKHKKKTHRAQGKESRKEIDLKEKQQKMIQETLNELDLLEDDSSPFEICHDSQKKLDVLETGTIKEVDERDEEETIFDKEGNVVFSRSLRSANSTKDKIPLEDHRMPSTDSDKVKYATNKNLPRDLLDTRADDHENYNIDRIMHNYNLSIESESVKFDEDLLNDSLKLEDNIF